MHVLVLVGSLRADSLNRHLADVAVGHLPAHATVTVSELPARLPFYSEDLDGADVPGAARAFREEVARADAVLVVTPEYNGSLPAVLKNAIDWTSRPRGSAALAGKRAAVLAATASPRAAQWVRDDAVRIMRVAGADVLEDTVGVPSASQLLRDGSLDGQLDTAVGALVRMLAREDVTAAA
ncbi:MAG TPA: NAD(P)H-dependent oxidoreductase [Dermatophilaceae bacterium]|nr:NAD(P)H-dependent oxidoreductase [Dermatophilaceae bacterium]